MANRYSASTDFLITSVDFRHCCSATNGLQSLLLSPEADFSCSLSLQNVSTSRFVIKILFARMSLHNQFLDAPQIICDVALLFDFARERFTR